MRVGPTFSLPSFDLSAVLRNVDTFWIGNLARPRMSSQAQGDVIYAKGMGSR